MLVIVIVLRHCHPYVAVKLLEATDIFTKAHSALHLAYLKTRRDVTLKFKKLDHTLEHRLFVLIRH
jgi:hypothetical protein